MTIQEKSNYLKTLHVYLIEDEKINNPNATPQELRGLAKNSLKETLKKRVTIGDGIQKGKTDQGGNPTGTFEIRITSLVKGLRPFQIQGLSINGSTWTLIETKDGSTKDEIREFILESPDSFSAIRLYDPVSGVYSNVYKLT
jgi:hypothetical protein